MTRCDNVAFLVPILALLQRTIDEEQSTTFCQDNSDAETKSKTRDVAARLRSVKCVCVAPTTVLAHQIYREFVKFMQGLSVVVYLLDEHCANDAASDMHVVISTPQPLAQRLANGDIPRHKIEMLVLDEADELLDAETALWVEEVEQVLSSCDHPRIQRALFSATLDDRVMNVTQISIGHGVRGKLISLLKLIDEGVKPPVLLFVASASACWRWRRS